jgi:hypothetical protein
MAKQTFTTGQVLTAAQMTSLQETAMGGGPATAKTTSYVLVAADAGKTVAMDAAGATTITVNTGLFAAGDTVFIQNLGAGACTVTAGTATVATAGSLILPQNDAGILYFTSASAAIFYDYIQAGAVSPLTTKGDLYTFSTSDARLPVGTNGHTLVANSSTSTGLEWKVDPVADLVTTAGDTLYATAADTLARLAIGTAGQVLQVNSGATAPEWATPAAGGGANWSLLNTGGTALTGSQTVTVSGISGKDKILVVVNNASSASAGSRIAIRLNTDTGSNYTMAGVQNTYGSTYNSANFSRTDSTEDRIYLGAIASSNAGEALAGYVLLSGCNSAGVKVYNSAGSGSGGNGHESFISGGIYNSATVISSVSVFSGTGNLDAGTVYVYTSA